MKVYLNGKMVDDSAATVSVFDAAVQHAVGLFETMHAYNGRVFRLEAHVDRLITSAKQTGLTDRLRHDPLCEAVELTLKTNDLTEARLRLTVTGGDLSLLGVARGASAAGEHHPTLLITAQAPAGYPPQFFTHGIAAIVADARANPLDPLASHKSLNYWARLRSLTQAAALKAGEALWLSVSNHLVGGAVSNAFVVKDGRLLTPIARGEEMPQAMASPVLPGITRAAVLEIAQGLNLSVEKKMIAIGDVLNADELFLTNSSWGVLPVIAVEKKAIGAGVPGPITHQVRAELSDLVEQECGITND
jgi:branched-chain amino acid aminotransferase